MNICGRYSFNNGIKAIQEKYPNLLREIEEIIAKIDASACKTKRSKNKAMPGRVLYSPRQLNSVLASEFSSSGWSKKRVKCKYPTEFYVPGYKPRTSRNSAFREIGFVKERLGVEIQLGKYASMVYSGCAKMTIFHNLGFIDNGVEIVPIKQFADEMSTGVSYFEQFVWDLEKRGVSNIDIPVLILGIDA
jgi:hypothetical protein